jgi:muramidase (phage lysozyme)
MIQNSQIKAFADTIADCEGTMKSTNPYRVLFGFANINITLNNHPSITGEWLGTKLSSTMCKNAGIKSGNCVSTAAGKYQFIKGTWLQYGKGLKFDENGQDEAFIRLIKDKGIFEDVVNGYIEKAVLKVGTVWASLPNNNYKQGNKTMEQFLKKFIAYGGGYFDKENNFLGNITITEFKKKKMTTKSKKKMYWLVAIIGLIGGLLFWKRNEIKAGYNSIKR